MEQTYKAIRESNREKSREIWLHYHLQKAEKPKEFDDWYKDSQKQAKINKAKKSRPKQTAQQLYEMAERIKNRGKHS